MTKRLIVKDTMFQRAENNDQRVWVDVGSSPETFRNMTDRGWNRVHHHTEKLTISVIIPAKTAPEYRKEILHGLSESAFAHDTRTLDNGETRVNFEVSSQTRGDVFKEITGVLDDLGYSAKIAPTKSTSKSKPRSR